ncbi:MAG: hypothetical protein LUC17_00030 [Oscillospiraceae bacterium]|nr:hypothetical protein [Oscillospiraceae bacterium]
MTDPDESAPELANLSAYTKAELLDYAAERGVSGVSGSMRKADIIAVIEGAE